MSYRIWGALALVLAMGCSGADGVSGLSGVDGEDGTEGQPGTGAVGPQGEMGSVGDPGPAGESGADGADGPAVLSSTAPASDTECPTGGSTVSFGADLDGDGTLDSDEVENSTVVCNGPAGGPVGPKGDEGAQGIQGIQGFQGNPGLTGGLKWVNAQDVILGDALSDYLLIDDLGLMWVVDPRRGTVGPVMVSAAYFLTTNCSGTGYFTANESMARAWNAMLPFEYLSEGFLRVVPPGVPYQMAGLFNSVENVDGCTDLSSAPIAVSMTVEMSLTSAGAPLITEPADGFPPLFIERRL